MAKEKEFEFDLGQRVRVKDTAVDLRVIGQIRFAGGSTGYVCSGWSYGHGALVRHTVDRCEIEAIPEDRSDG